jgi:hypothetical protein
MGEEGSLVAMAAAGTVAAPTMAAGEGTTILLIAGEGTTGEGTTDEGTTTAGAHLMSALLEIDLGPETAATTIGGSDAAGHRKETVGAVGRIEVPIVL